MLFPAEPMCEQSPQSRRLWVRGKVEREGIEMVLGGIRRVQRCLAANQTVLMPRSRELRDTRTAASPGLASNQFRKLTRSDSLTDLKTEETGWTPHVLSCTPHLTSRLNLRRTAIVILL
ncbi:hypothetical protein AOLI_G00132670 [Acnodon oligacanthus]